MQCFRTTVSNYTRTRQIRKTYDPEILLQKVHGNLEETTPRIMQSYSEDGSWYASEVAQHLENYRNSLKRPQFAAIYLSRMCFRLFEVLFVKTVYKRMFLYKCPLYDHSWPFFHHMYDHLSQNWGSDGHFEVLNRSYLWLVEKLWHKTQIFPFLFFFVILYKNRRLHIFCFLHFCVFCHNLCAN